MRRTYSKKIEIATGKIKLFEIISAGGSNVYFWTEPGIVIKIPYVRNWTCGNLPHTEQPQIKRL
jgi:hypothetical protein